MACPQKENGYTAISNELLEALAGIRISGEARQCLDVIIRKTYGFNKKEDAISLSQFVLLTKMPKATVCRALLKLANMNIIIVKNDNDLANLYRLNKDYSIWKPLTKKITIIKNDNGHYQKRQSSLTIMGHTKDNTTKDTITKETIPKGIEQANVEYGNQDINSLLKEFKQLMGFKSSSNKDRIFAHHLLNNFTSEQLTYMLTYCATQEYAPRIGSLEKMWYKRGDIVAGIKSEVNKQNKSNIVKI